MNHDSFEDAINDLATEVQEAQIAISQNGVAILKEVFNRVRFSGCSFRLTVFDFNRRLNYLSTLQKN